MLIVDVSEDLSYFFTSNCILQTRTFELYKCRKMFIKIDLDAINDQNTLEFRTNYKIIRVVKNSNIFAMC